MSGMNLRDVFANLHTYIHRRRDGKEVEICYMVLHYKQRTQIGREVKKIKWGRGYKTYMVDGRRKVPNLRFLRYPIGNLQWLDDGDAKWS